MTTTSLFHLDKQQAQQVLKLNIDNKTLPPEPYPKYLGVALDRILATEHTSATYPRNQTHEPLLSASLQLHNWGANQTVLRVSVLQCYSVGEYCAAVWESSAHTKNIRTTMHIMQQH